MRELSATLLFALATAVLGCPSAAADTSPASPAPQPASLAAVRLGYVSPTARTLLTQPVLDRYANDIQTRLAHAISASILPMPTARGASVASASMCQLLHLSGFVEPHARWQITSSSVIAATELVITDCDGNMFYNGHSSIVNKRDDTLSPQAQIDAAQDTASTELLHKFQAYKAVHEPQWNLLIHTGSMSGHVSLQK